MDFEKLIEIIVREIIAELKKRGEVPDFTPGEKSTSVRSSVAIQTRLPLVMDFSAYKTPLLTENILAALDPGIVEIVIPHNTIITLGARDVIKKRNLKLINTQEHRNKK